MYMVVDIRTYEILVRSFEVQRMDNQVGKTNKRKRAEKERKKNEFRSGGVEKAEVHIGGWPTVGH